jgi:hypothetical protein
MDVVDRLYPWVTIEMLPDDVLLETFEFYLGKDAVGITYSHDHNGWQTLVHVCRRWRSIVFASPRRLDLKLYCSRDLKTLDIWPELPIVIFANNLKSKEDVTNVIDALRHHIHNRVCKIYYSNGKFHDSLLEEVAAIDEPFPALTNLKLVSFRRNVPVLPDSFLGGSAPLLRLLDLNGIPYPTIGRLLSSTTNLVCLHLWRIPHSGYIPPETIVPLLSALPRLESLSLGFQHPRSRAQRANRHPHPLTRVVIPNLALLHFRGNIEYLEGLLSQIETPMLNESDFCLFNQLVFDTPLLGHFICHTKTFLTISGARVRFWDKTIWITLFGREEVTNNNRKVLDLEISCHALDWQVSAVTQVLNSFLSSLPALEALEILASHKGCQDEIEAIQWREFLHPFTSVKTMTLESEDPVRLIAPALQKFAEERATRVLPALQNLFLKAYSSRPSGLFKEAIERFITARQFYGQPVTVRY